MNNLQKKLENYAYLFGYRSIETPIFESVDAFLTKAGNQIFDKLITFDLSGTTMALRPEFTASIAQQVSEESDLPLRYQCYGPVFHHSEKVSNNFQQQSFGIELIGSDDVFADAEVIAFVILALEKVGITNFQVVIGHVGLTRALLENFGLNNRLLRYILNRRNQITDDLGSFLQSMKADFDFESQIHETASMNASNITAQQMLYSTFKRTNMSLGNRSAEDIVRRIGEQQQSTVMYDRVLTAIEFLSDWSSITGSIKQTKGLLAKHIHDELSQTLFTNWLQCINRITEYGVEPDRLIIEPDLVRDWDYYTGVVFEIRLDDGTYIGGGGRYNDFIRLLNKIKQQIPAIGCALNLETIYSVMQNIQEEVQVFTLIDVNGVGDRNLIRWSQELRKHNIPIEVKTSQNTSNNIFVDNGYAIYADKSYSFDQVDALAATLKG